VATKRAPSRRAKSSGKGQGGISARARVIWVALVASMTTVGGVLYALDPSAKSSEAQALMAKSRTSGTSITKAQTGRWSRIVLVDTGSPFADAGTLREQGAALGVAEGVGYHFVIGNGRGLDDGKSYECNFWRDQRAGSELYAPGLIDDRTIVVALVGNSRRDRLTESQFERTRVMVADLMRQHGISFDRVDFSKLGPGFGAAAFREAFGG
jgi:hypothetical protein